MSEPENNESALSTGIPATVDPAAPIANTPPPPPVKPVVVPPVPPKKTVPLSNDPISRFRNKTEVEDARMGFIDHLMELRKRLWVSIIAVAACILVALIFYEVVYAFLLEPIRIIDEKYVKIYSLAGKPPADGHIIHITTTEPLGSMLSVIWLGFWAGLVIAAPIVVYELWAFVSPGLHDKEKGAIKPVLYGGAFFFVAGTAIAYFILAPLTFDFFLWLDLRLKVTPNWTAEKCVELLITMMVVSGLLWEIPLLVAGMARFGMLSAGWLLKYWRGLTFGSIVLGAIVSPGNDLISMGAFSGMILGIYLISILMAAIFYRKSDDPYAGNPSTNGIQKS